MASKQDKNKKYEIPEKHVRGKKRMRGQPILHEQVKVKLNLTLTPLAVEYITKAAESKGISRSELIEQWARTTLNQDEV